MNAINYLKDAQLVADFQHFFGIQSITDDYHTNGDSNQIDKLRKRSKHKLTNGLSNHDANSHKNGLSNGLVDKNQNNLTDTKVIKKNYKINSLAFYYLFCFGASLGYEVFYAIFFPFFLHNIDSYVARRLIFIWVITMYIGQSLKDVIRWNRPKSPPVIVLEPEYSMEYGMPSTHAMVGLSLPFSVFIFTQSRYVYPFWFGLTLASVWCILVCGSRLYLGMHTVLDVLAGLLLSATILCLCAPVIDQIDRFNLENTFSPFITFLIIAAMSIYYPKSDRWSPARGDTCVMIGFGYGVVVGSWLNYHLDCMTDPIESAPFQILLPTGRKVINSLFRMIGSAVIVEFYRLLGKKFLYPALCSMQNLNPKDPESKKAPGVEVPLKLAVYSVIGINICFNLPILFNYLNI